MSGSIGGRTPIARPFVAPGPLPKLGVAEVGNGYIGPMAAWWKANDAGTVHQTGGVCTQLDDRSGHGNHLQGGTGSGSSVGPATGGTLGGKAALTFGTDGSGNGRMLSLFGSYPASGLGIGINATLYMVCSLVNTTGNKQTLFGLTNSFGCAPHLDYLDATYNNPSPAELDAAGGCGGGSAGPLVTPAGSYLIRFKFIGAGSTEIYVGGVGTVATGHGLSANPLTRFVLGEDGPTKTMFGVFGEGVIYAGAFDATVDSALRGYLAGEWGVTA